MVPGVNAAAGAYVRADARLHLVRYEDLVADPVRTFQEVYDWVDLPWSADVQRSIVSATTTPDRAPARRFRWSGLSKTAYRPMASSGSLDSYRQRLSAAEIQRAADLTATVRATVYDS